MHALRTATWGLLVLGCFACAETEPAAPSPADGGGDAPEPLQVIADEEDEPYRLALDDRYVYWTTRTAVRRAPRSGGAAETLATGEALRRVAASSGQVFFTDGAAGTVSRVARSDGPIEVIGSGVQPDGIAARDDAVYWANAGLTFDDGTVMRTGLDGGDATVLADGLARPGAIAVHGGFVYYTSTAQSCGSGSGRTGGCTGGGVGKVPLAGGSAQVVGTQGAPVDLAVGEQGVYWMSTPGPRVLFAPHDGPEEQVLAEVPGEDIGPVAVDDEAFYFSSSSRGRVMKLSLDGGAAQPLVTDLGTVGGIAVDDAWVYVAATSEGRILRVAKDGSASRPEDPITGPCVTPIGEESEIAATPRADANLELLALRLDEGRVVATEETYERVVADVAAIRQAEPMLAEVGYFAPHDGKTLLLTPSDVTFQSIDVGDYSAWDCLNDFYGLEELELLRSQLASSMVQLTLKRHYDLNLLAELYAMLPGIESAESTGRVGDGPTICARRDGADIEYVVDRAGGDCPAGCTTHEAHRFRSTAPGQIEMLDVWDSEAQASAPEWFRTVCAR